MPPTTTRPYFNLFWGRRPPGKPVLNREIDRCPYCRSKRIVKNGLRENKFQIIQYYRCNACGRLFTPQIVKHKTFPLRIILDAVSFYNLGFTKADACRLIKEKYGLIIKSRTLNRWLAELSELTTYKRFREKVIKEHPPHQLIQSAILNHQQVYHFRFHQAKLQELFKYRPFIPKDRRKLSGYLDAIINDYPHNYFTTEKRSSGAKLQLNFNQVRVESRDSHATRLAQLVLQAVIDNRMRHDTLQQFMLVNDSVTVAMEIPIYLTPKDLRHYKEKLGFNIPLNLQNPLTGHIDLLQIRNGFFHILDFKPRAKSQKPYSQLLLYALALSRRTGLMLKQFKCAWFDENHYFEFFPLQLVHKLKKK